MYDLLFDFLVRKSYKYIKLINQELMNFSGNSEACYSVGWHRNARFISRSYELQLCDEVQRREKLC